MRRFPLFAQTAVLLAFCLSEVAVISVARGETPARPVSKPAKAVTAAKPGTIAALHAVQQHHRLGGGDMYVGGASVKWIFNDGDFVCLFRALEQKVYLFLPAQKAVFEETFAQFRQRGIKFTAGGQRKCEVLKLKEIPKNTQFQKFPVRVFTIYGTAVSSRGDKRLIDIGTLTTMAEPTKMYDVADFISLAYGLPKSDSVILDMTMKFHVADASLWFKTSEKDLPSDREGSPDSWLKTLKLENVTVPFNFFDAPKNFRKVESQEKIMGMAPAAKAFEELMFAEPEQRR